MQTTSSDTLIREFVADWYRKLDRHVTLDELLPMVSSGDLTMKFPEATLRDRSEFARWYDTVTHKFFDEAHTVKQVVVHRNGGDAQLDVLVNWQARMWEAPDARSKGLNFDSQQSWVVRDEPEGLVITVYDVKSLTPLPGSASL